MDDEGQRYETGLHGQCSLAGDVFTEFCGLIGGTKSRFFLRGRARLRPLQLRTIPPMPPAKREQEGSARSVVLKSKRYRTSVDPSIAHLGSWR